VISLEFQCMCLVFKNIVNPLNAKLNPTCHSLALLGAHRILYISRVRVNIVILMLFCAFYKYEETDMIKTL